LLPCCIHFLSQFFHFCVYVQSTCCLKLLTTHFGDEQQHTRGRHCKCVKSWDSNCAS
jgi:ubiquitin-protein ligase